MNDHANAKSTGSPALDVLGGIHLLGCGINQLSWASAGMAGRHVLDATSNPRKKKLGEQEYEVGQNVEFTPKTGSLTQINTFESSADYHSKSSLKANASGSYGAFSAGFEATFEQQIDVLNEYYAAVYSHAEQLWTLEVKNTEVNLHAEFIADIESLPDFKSDYSNVGEFIDFFKRYGVDVVSQLTVGGNLTYSILTKKTSTQKKTELSAKVKASYGTFVSNASASISEDMKTQAKEQHVTIKTSGGTQRVTFDLNAPGSCHEQFETWSKSLPHAPRIVDIVLTPITSVIPAKLGKQKAALEQARKWYLHYEATIEANWQTSHIEVVNASPQASAPKASVQAVTGTTHVTAQSTVQANSRPALHIVIVGKDRHPRVDIRLDAPERHEDAAAFAAFWNKAAVTLDTVTEFEVVLLATERWPRSRQYYPSNEMFTRLRNHGASQQTLHRWEKLVQDMQPCLVAGITYVLAGKGLTSQATDFVAAGFGTPGQNNIRPSVNVSARFIQDDARETRTLITSWTEDTNTRLHTIQNRDGDHLALAAGSKDKTRIEMVDGNPKKGGRESNLGQFWYLMPWSTPYGNDIKHPHILINFETGACLQGKHDKTECRLFPFGDEERKQQDDVIWDVRDGAEPHFLLVHWYHDHFNLTQTGQTAAVRPWRENYMIWILNEYDNFQW